MNTKPLTVKQERFCQYYIDTGIASEAYRMAYSTGNMKPATVNNNAYMLLKRSEITARVKELRAIDEEAHRVNRAKVEQVLMGIVEVDPAELYFVDENTGKVKVKSPHQMPVRVRKALKTIKNKKGEISYEFNGKTEAARLLASMNGWEKPKEVKLTGGDSPVKTELRIGFEDED
jgi:phage terminase small subunit